MRLLLIEPGASSSTSDVSAGLRYGLERHGVDLVRYRLDQRIDRSHRWLHHNWRRTKKKNPDIVKPTAADVFYQAGIGALEMGLRHRVDAVLVVSAMFLHPDVVILMKRAGLRVVVLFTESPYDHEHELKIARLVDGCWTNERTVVQAFRAVNPNSGYLAHGWHPERHFAGVHPGDAELPAHDVVFVGTAFPARVRWFAAMDWSGIDLGLYGNWDSLGSRHHLRQYVRGGTTANDITAGLYRRAKVGINLYRASRGWGDGPAVHAESLNPRAYELARCGAFSLSTHRQESLEIFGALVPTIDLDCPDESTNVIRTWLADRAGVRTELADQLPACVAESSWVERSAQVIGDLQTLLRGQAAVALTA
jgi:spore maturation protein CgeB